MGLAKIAKDAAAIENIEASEALEKLLQSIEFGNARALRSAGLRVDFVKDLALEELKLGRALSDNETVQVRYNAVVRAAVAIQGAHAGAAGTAEAQMKALGRETHELREAIGAQFQEEYKKFAQTMREFVGWAKDNVGVLVPVAEAIKSIAIVIVAYEVAPKILSVVRALAAFRLAAIGAWVAANPFALMAAGVASFGIVLWNEKKKLDQMNESLGETVKKAKVLDALRQGKSLAQMKEMGVSEDDVRAALRGKGAIGGEPEGNFGNMLPKLNIQTGPTAEDLKLAAEIRRKQMEAVRSSAEGALQAEQASIKGPAKALLELQKDALKYSTFVDEKGVLHKFTLLAETRENLERELSAKVQAMQTGGDGRVSQGAAGGQSSSGLPGSRTSTRSAFSTRSMWRPKPASTWSRFTASRSSAPGLRGMPRCAQSMPRMPRRSSRSWRSNSARWGSRSTTCERVHEIKLRLFDLETSRMVLEEEARLRALGYQAERINQRIGEITQQREDIRQQMSEQTDAAIGAARESAAIRQTQMVRDQNRQIFDSLKQQAGGVFDALLTKSQSVWSAIGNSLKTALLTAIKDVVSSRVAAMLMQLFTGQKVSFAGGGGGMGGGVMGGIGGTAGHRCGSGVWRRWQRGHAAGHDSRYARFNGNRRRWRDAGVAVFHVCRGRRNVRGRRAGGGATGVGAGGGMFSKAGLMGTLSSYKGMLTKLGNIGYGPKGGDFGGEVAGSYKGVGGWQGGAMLAGGSVLAMDGLRRGGWAGVGETTAGGALIGGKFGGPVGALIGGLIGFGAGIARLFIKSAAEKVQEKVKSLYGLSIPKSMAQQIVQIAQRQVRQEPGHGGTFGRGSGPSEAVRANHGAEGTAWPHGRPAALREPD